MTEAIDSKLADMHSTNLGEIGEVMHLAKSGRLVVKLHVTGAGLRAGDLLVDGSGKRVGKIAELIGPVSAPYASVIPMTDRAGRFAGNKVYAGGRPEPRRAGARGRRDRK